MSKYKKIVVKVGTNVLTREDGLLDFTNISLLVDQIAAAKRMGVQVILVSSGAVGAGRTMVNLPETTSRVVRRQMLSAIGQVRLMEIYRQLLANHGLFCAQVLATKEDFRDRVHYLNMRNCFRALVRDDIVPIVNENDVISVNELMFTDNDELAGLVAAMTNADALLILSTVDGVLKGAPGTPEAEVIPVIDPFDTSVLQYIMPSKSSFGRGGMQTKFRIAQKTTQLGIHTYIANGKRPNIILDILADNYIGTVFPGKEQVSNVKKWMAYSDGGFKGTVYINEGAVSALRNPEKISSLLPVGIVRLEGEFQKGDLLQIMDEHGNSIGMGMAQYSAATAAQYLGQQGKRALVHYDYLLINN